MPDPTRRQILAAGSGVLLTALLGCRRQGHPPMHLGSIIMPKTLHLVLVCHAELGLDGTWNDYDQVQPRLDRLCQEVAQATGRLPRITYCLTAEFITDRLDEAIRLHQAGHEIGVHSHLPGSHRQRHSYRGRYALALDDQGILNQDRVAGPLRQILISLGFPPPQTHVSGMFSFQRHTVRLLAEAGFAVDCSLIPNGQRIIHHATGDFVIADNRRCRDRRPYLPALDDPWTAGGGSLVELPVSGNLGEAYFAMDWAKNLNDEIRRIDERLAALAGVDVYQSYFHHFEFSRVHPWTHGNFDRARRFLEHCGRQQDLCFSTAQAAAAAVRAAVSGGRGAAGA